MSDYGTIVSYEGMLFYFRQALVESYSLQAFVHVNFASSRERAVISVDTFTMLMCYHCHYQVRMGLD